MTVAAHTGATAAGSSTAPKITVPVDAATGDVFLVNLSLNNTDVITSEPANLHTIGTNINVSGSAQFASRLYWGLVDGTNITAGTALTWATSATRTWAVTLEAYTGVNQSTPVHASNQVQSTSAHVAPAITTTVTSHLVEVAAFKPSSSTLITSMAPATGWGVRQSLSSASSFAPAAAVAGYDTGNPVTPGTYGSDTWTLNTSTNPEALYTVALLPATVAPHAGSAAGAVTFTGAATGSVTRSGTAAGVVTFTGSAAGQALRKGSAAGTITFTSAASGVAPVVGVHSGSASGLFTFAGTASGITQRTGSATGTYQFVGAAHGTSANAADVTVTAALDPRPWASALTTRTNTGLLVQRSWEARLE